MARLRRAAGQVVDSDVRGVVSAWCADEYLLGQKQACNTELASALPKGYLNGSGFWPSGARFVAALQSSLAKWGYLSTARAVRVWSGRLGIRRPRARRVAAGPTATRSPRSRAAPATARSRGTTLTQAVDGSDAVVNLAGTSIGSIRWTDARKKSILASRATTTRTLVRAIKLRSSGPASSSLRPASTTQGTRATLSSMSTRRRAARSWPVSASRGSSRRRRLRSGTSQSGRRS